MKEGAKLRRVCFPPYSILRPLVKFQCIHMIEIPSCGMWDLALKKGPFKTNGFLGRTFSKKKFLERSSVRV